jgi:hypothetical protein
LPEVNIAGAPIAAAHTAAAEAREPAPRLFNEQQLCPYREPTASWSLLQSYFSVARVNEVAAEVEILVLWNAVSGANPDL